MVDELVRPTPLEIATGWLLGEVDPDDEEDFGWRWLAAPSPRQALEAVVLRALRRPPCVVDFSGGRDSSLVLAVATHVARREGLPLPVPRTNRFPLDPMSNEDDWQELVVRHLKLDDWEIWRVTDELDVVGERAQECLMKYGLLVPERLYVNMASIEVARGGSYITGEGGDEVLGPRRARFARAAVGAPKVVARSRSLSVAVARNLSPRWARFFMLWYDSSRAPTTPWLRPGPARRYAFQSALSRSREPISWRAFLRWHLRRRVPRTLAHNLNLIAADYDVLHLQPLLDRAFVASLARCGGVFGFATRTEAMKFLAEDLLPSALIERESKPIYNTAYFTETAKGFAQSWDGTGIDEDLVDSDKLRSAWLRPTPNAASFALLQSVWLAKHSKLETRSAMDPVYAVQT